MRLFVAEFITGGGIANDPLPEGLKQEGQLMLHAVLEDCSKIEGMHLVTTYDARMSLSIKDVEVHIVEDAIDYIQQLTLIARQCDATWIIAPESEGILQSIITHLKKENITLINCNVDSIKIASDKYICAQYLLQHEIKTIPCLSREQLNDHLQPVMIKARYGVGCDGLRRCENGLQALQYINDFSRWIAQPYIEGNHLSMCLLFSCNGVTVLCVNQQILEGEISLTLKSCLVNAYAVNTKHIELAEQLLHAFPGFNGYVGVDVIEASDDFYVVDINPRLTSSYVGLSGILKENPSELCLNSVINKQLPSKVDNNEHVIEVRVG